MRGENSGSLHWKWWEDDPLRCPCDAQQLGGFPHRTERMGGLEEHSRYWDHDGRCVKILIPGTDMDKFNLDLTARDHIKMITFLWFNEGVPPLDRERVQLELQHALVRVPTKVKEECVRTTLELAPDKRLCSKVQEFACAQCGRMSASKKTVRYQVGFHWDPCFRKSCASWVLGRDVTSCCCFFIVGSSWVMNRQRLHVTTASWRW